LKANGATSFSRQSGTTQTDQTHEHSDSKMFVIRFSSAHTTGSIQPCHAAAQDATKASATFVKQLSDPVKPTESDP